MKLRYASALAFALTATGATASTVGFDLTIEGNWNTPFITVENTSTSGVMIDSFSISIGDTSRNFDWARNKKAPVEDQPLVAPDGGTVSAAPDIGDNAGTNFDVLEFSFTGFDTGESFKFITDIDLDTDAGAWLFFNETLFNNGTGVNSVAEVIFSNDQVLSFTLPDVAGPRNYSTERPYIFEVTAPLQRSPGRQAQQANPVPLPASAPLILAGIAAIGLLRRRKG